MPTLQGNRVGDAPDAARDEILAVFKATWDLTGYAVVWSDNAAQPPAAEQPWARVTLRHADGRQTSLTNAGGAKKHTHVGTLYVQLFLPIGQGVTMGYPLARQVLQAYRAARGSVWYRNHRFREVGDDGAFEQINCLIDFTYDDL